MENWDQEKLESVVATKGGAQKNRPTDIVCKFFIEAIEKELYGWFWGCPNGGDACQYRHALPPGYVFKSRRQRELEAAMAEEAEMEQTLEELIEEQVCAGVRGGGADARTTVAQRARLPAEGLTPVTLATFTKWKADRAAKKAAEARAARARARMEICICPLGGPYGECICPMGGGGFVTPRVRVLGGGWGRQTEAKRVEAESKAPGGRGLRTMLRACARVPAARSDPLRAQTCSPGARCSRSTLRCLRTTRARWTTRSS